MPSCPTRATLFPYTTLFRSPSTHGVLRIQLELDGEVVTKADPVIGYLHRGRSEEHTSELQSLRHLVCHPARLALPSFPTRRSSDLPRPTGSCGSSWNWTARW